VECSEEIGGHGTVVGGDGLVFYGTDFDDAGVVDQDVNAAEVADGVIEEHGGLGGVGEVSWNEEDVVGGLDGFAIEEGLASADEFFDIAGGQDQLGSGAAVAFGECEAEAAGAPGDKDDLTGAFPGAGLEGVGCCDGDDAGENLGGVEGGSRFVHSYR